MRCENEKNSIESLKLRTSNKKAYYHQFFYFYFGTTMKIRSKIIK